MPQEYPLSQLLKDDDFRFVAVSSGIAFGLIGAYQGFCTAKGIPNGDLPSNTLALAPAIEAYTGAIIGAVGDKINVKSRSLEL